MAPNAGKTKPPTAAARKAEHADADASKSSDNATSGHAGSGSDSTDSNRSSDSSEDGSPPMPRPRQRDKDENEESSTNGSQPGSDVSGGDKEEDEEEEDEEEEDEEEEDEEEEDEEEEDEDADVSVAGKRDAQSDMQDDNEEEAEEEAEEEPDDESHIVPPKRAPSKKSGATKPGGTAAEDPKVIREPSKAGAKSGTGKPVASKGASHAEEKPVEVGVKHDVSTGKGKEKERMKVKEKTHGRPREDVMDIDEPDKQKAVPAKKKSITTSKKADALDSGEDRRPALKPAARKPAKVVVKDTSDSDSETSPPPKPTKEERRAASAKKKSITTSKKADTLDSGEDRRPALKPAARKPAKVVVEDTSDDEASPPPKPGRKTTAANRGSPAKEKQPQRMKPMAADKNVNDMDASDRIARIQANLRRALLGTSKLNIGVPNGEVKLRWGDVNDRALNHSHVAGLARSIRDGGKQADRYPVYAAIPRNWIDATSLSAKGTEWKKLKLPTYTAEGLGRTVKVLSGHHRQQALESLIAEYQKNLQKSKAELASVQKAIKKADGDSESLTTQLRQMQHQVTRITNLYNETGFWVVEWYDDGILTDESRAHLSENADFPTMPAGNQEKAYMLMWLVRSVAVQWARKHSEKVLPTPGSDIWETEILQHAVTATQAKNGSINFLVKHRVQYELYSMALEYPYFREPKNLSIAQLGDAMQTPANKTLKEVRTLGTFWAWLIRQGLTQMNMTANSRAFPILEDDEDEATLPLQNLLSVLEHSDEDLRVSDAVWSSMKNVKDCQNPTPYQHTRSQERQREYVDKEYMEFEDDMTAVDDDFYSDVFDKTILEQVDTVYGMVFGAWDAEEKAVHFLDSSSEVFSEIMKEYNKEVTSVLNDEWRRRRMATKARHAEQELSAYTNAEAKMSWIMKLRSLGYYANIPFPTKTFIQDSLDRLEMASQGFRSLCRLVDPLCDSIIRRTTEVGTGDIWDYTGYMVFYLGQQNSLKLFDAETDNEHDLCKWILGHMRLLDDTSSWFISYADAHVRKFISMSNANWTDPMKPHNMAKRLLVGESSIPDGDESATPDTSNAAKQRGKKPPPVKHAPPGTVEHSLPPVLRAAFPDFPWPLESAQCAAAMAEHIAGAIAAASASSAKAKGTAKKGGKAKADADADMVWPSKGNNFDIVARALPEIWIARAQESKPLYMLYRHAFDWRTHDLRSVPDKAWSYAYRLLFAWYCHERTWGQMITHASCHRLRLQFFEFLSERALPIATTVPTGGGPGAVANSPTKVSGPPYGWANWDHSFFGDIKRAAKKHGLMTDDTNSSRAPRAVLESAKRWAKYADEAKSIVTTVQGCLCTLAGNTVVDVGKATQRKMDPTVATILGFLLMAAAANADRLEHRMLSGSVDDPWALPGRIGLREALFPAIPTGDPDPNAFSNLHDFAMRDRERFDRFLEGLLIHGYPAGDDMNEFFNMERERPQCEVDGPSRLINPRRLGPIMPQDMNWREEWAKKPAPKRKNRKRKARGAPDAEPQGDGAPLPDLTMDVDVPPPSGDNSGTFLPTPQPSQAAAAPNAALQDHAPAAVPLSSKPVANSVVGESAANVNLDVDDEEMSPPPPNQAALKSRRPRLSTQQAGSPRGDDGGLAGQSLPSPVTSLADNSALEDLGHSTSSESDDATPSPNTGGRNQSQDPFANNLATDGEPQDTEESVPTQLVDSKNRPRIAGTDWPAHCSDCIDDFEGAIGPHDRKAPRAIKFWKVLWKELRVKYDDDPVPPVVIDYLLSLDCSEATVDGVKHTLLDPELGPLQLLNDSEAYARERSVPLVGSKRSRRHKKRVREQAAFSPQTSPSSKRDAKRSKKADETQD